MSRYYMVLETYEDIETGQQIMEGQLLTHAERFAIAPNASDDLFEEININKNITTKRYGSRFLKHGAEFLEDLR